LPNWRRVLAQVAPSLATTATIAILIKASDGGFALNVRRKLEGLGFRIEAGVRCRQGLVLSAHRQGFAMLDRAA
jgi:hypothetical protein